MIVAEQLDIAHIGRLDEIAEFSNGYIASGEELEMRVLFELPLIAGK